MSYTECDLEAKVGWCNVHQCEQRKCLARLRVETDRLTEALRLIAQRRPAPGFERAGYDALQMIARRALGKEKEK